MSSKEEDTTSSSSSSMDRFFSQGRRTNQMTPDELSRVASEPQRIDRTSSAVIVAEPTTSTSRSSIDDYFTMSRRTNQMTPEELSRVASEPQRRNQTNVPKPITMTMSHMKTTNSIDDYFTMSRRTNQMTPEELLRVASEPKQRSSTSTNHMTTTSLAIEHSRTVTLPQTTTSTSQLHRALEIFQRLKYIDKEEARLRLERIKLRDELGTILIQQQR